MNASAKITARTITDDQIRELRREAAQVGDHEQVRLCDRALAGRGGKAKCAATIQAAHDQEPSLNHVLAHHGYTTAPGPFPYTKRILRNGIELFCGRHELVTAWLRERGELHIGGVSCS